MVVEKKTSADLAGLLALPCRIGEFSCVPPHNEEEKPLGSAPIINNWYKTSVNYFWPMGIYVCVRQFSEALTSGFIHVITSLCRDLFVLYGARCSCLWCLVALAALKYMLQYVAISIIYARPTFLIMLRGCNSYRIAHHQLYN